MKAAASSYAGRGRNRIEARREAEEAFNTEVQAALRGTVSNAGGCSSYWVATMDTGRPDWTGGDPAVTPSAK